MQLVTIVLIGFLVGLFAKILVPGRDPGGVGSSILFGIAGAFAAGAGGQATGYYLAGGKGAGVVASVFGAVFAVAMWRLLNRLYNKKVEW